MTTYEIVGETVSISTAVENERYIRVNTEDLITQAVKNFDAWYDSQGDLKSVDKNITSTLSSTLLPVCEKCIEILAQNGIYSIDATLFFETYIIPNSYELFDVIDGGLDKLGEIDDQKRAEIQYRQARKASRGRVVGGGFGLGGAIKGMATAGVINATTGMAHSLGNAVGNMGSSISASASKASVYRGLKGELHKHFVALCYSIRDAARTELKQKANMECKYVTVEESNQARAIIANYTEGRIPESQKKKQIAIALQLNPYNMSVYELIWNDYGDQNGDLSKMCKYFGGSLEDYIKRISEQYGDEVFKKYCNVYEQAFNKRLVGAESERDVKTALNTLIEYCNEHGVSQEIVPQIQKCKDILTNIDRELKTVHGTVYETRELAEEVRADYHLFYRALQGRRTLDELVYGEIKNLNYKTAEFRGELSGLYELEREWRKPEKIENSLRGLLMHNVTETVISGGWINIGEKAMEQRLSIIRTIIAMQTDEVPLVLFSRSDNGKSGVLITNQALRIYSKGFFSNENKCYSIESIETVECVDSDQYLISIKGQESIRIPLKHESLSADEQVSLGDFINKAVKMVNNLYAQDRERLYRILNAAYVCVCGEYVLPGETICPSCRRMMTASGEFVETKECPNCHSLVAKEKKFCSSCGYSFYGETRDSSSKAFVDVNMPVENGPMDGNAPIEKQGSSVLDRAEREPSDMEYSKCPNCGYQILPGKKFCSRCGQPIQNGKEAKGVESVIKCHKCGNPIRPGKKFCTVCGTRINEEGE